jgi:hypothetical protein
MTTSRRRTIVIGRLGVTGIDSPTATYRRILDDRGVEEMVQPRGLTTRARPCGERSCQNRAVTSGSPQLPRDSRAQAIGRRGEAAVADLFTRNGWIVVGNGQGTDFGIDLAAFRRSESQFVLTYALSIQVKAVERAQVRTPSATARVRSSTLASWLWSTTPTICVLHETSTGRSWWTTPGSAVSNRSPRGARSRTLRFDRSLDGADDWSSLTQTVVDQWSHHQGLGALMALRI